MAPVPRRASYDDLQAVPPHQVGEFIDGELQVSPRPANPHAAAIAALNDELGPPFRRGRGGPGGWIILDAPELHVGGDVLVPIWPGGAGPACRCWRTTCRTSRSSRTGCARCCRRPPPRQTGRRSCRPTPAKACRTSGWSIRSSARARCCAARARSRSSSRSTAATRRSTPSRSTPSSSRSLWGDVEL